jgi:hypothetical protein
MEYSKTLFCSSKFTLPCHKISSNCTDSLVTPLLKVSPALPYGPKDLGPTHPEIQVECLSSATTSFLQQPKMVIIKTFKKCYTHRPFHGILIASDDENSVIFSERLKSYSRLNCMKQ